MGSDSVPRLRDALRELHRNVEAPTFQELSTAAARAGLSLADSTAHDLLNKTSGIPRWKTVHAFVGACQEHHRQQVRTRKNPALADTSTFDVPRWHDLYEAERTALLMGATGGDRVPAPARLGKPIGECTPMALEVHHAIDLPGQESSDKLPTYILRAHDERLKEAVDAAADGSSRIVMLVGGSSTGKTRAGWEAIQALASEPTRAGQGWWVWHPIDPSRPAAAAAALERIDAFTVVWLNEAQHYLLPSGNPQLGERIAAGLRSLLADSRRAPVLVLGTMWPSYWATLTTRPAQSEKDRYAQARDLLTGTDLSVPDAFSTADLNRIRETAASDPRLRHAVRHAEAGRITQHLAGVPELLARYRNAPTVPRAVIHAAIDARRLGHPPAIPHAFLAHAAPGYLTDHEWEQAGQGWLEQSLVYTAAACHGVPGPLTLIRPRPGEPIPAATHYRLADYLEQAGRTERAGIFPPASFWDAVTAAISDPAILTMIGQQADIRGRYRRATQLYWHAADRGDALALRILAKRRQKAGDCAGAETLALQAADRGDTTWLSNEARRRETAGDHAGAQALALQAADRGDTFPLFRLAFRREQAGDHANAEELYRQAADCGDVRAMRHWAVLRERSGDHANAMTLALKAADRGDTDGLCVLATLRTEAEDYAGAERLCREASDRGDTRAMLLLAWYREQAGDHADAEALALQAADCGHERALRTLAEWREEGGNLAGAEKLYQQAIDRGDTQALRTLAQRRRDAGDHLGAEQLYQQAVECGGTDALWSWIGWREAVGDQSGIEELYQRAADHGDYLALTSIGSLRADAGDLAGVEQLYRQAVDRGEIRALNALVELRDEAGDSEDAETLALQAADHGNTDALRALAERREAAGDPAGAEKLYQQAIRCGDVDALRTLAWLREHAEDLAGAEVLALQAADRGNNLALRTLAERREAAGDHTCAEMLLLQAADRADADALHSLAQLRERAGDRAGADHIRRWGLTDQGTPSDEW